MSEEINAKLGYYYMCLTNSNFYQNHKKEIIDIAQKASHSSEESLKLSKDVFEKEVEADLSKEVKDVLSCLIKNIVKPEEILEKESNGEVPKGLETTLNACKPSADSMTAPSKTSTFESQKKMSNTFKKCKGNSSLTSFLKLKFAKNKFAGSKPAKGPSTKAVAVKSTKVAGAVKDKRSEEIPTAVVCAEREKTESLGVKKVKNAAVVDTKKENTLEVVVVEEETVTNEDPGLESTQPIYQTGIMDDGGDSDSSIKILEIKDALKTVHSKHCRKRILGKDSRFKVAAKTKVQEEPISDSFNMTSAKNVSASESGNKSSSSKLFPKKNMGFSKNLVISSSKSTPSRKVTSLPIQKVSRTDIKSPFNKYSKSSLPKIVHKKENETLKQRVDVFVAKDLSSKWKPVTSSPKTSMNVSSSKPSHALKAVSKNLSPVPVQKSSVERIVRDLSRSPVRRIKSPLRIIHRSPIRKLHRSPVRRHSRSPFRRSSRSPYRKLSKSPPRRKSRSPKRHRSRSPLRRHSRSPLRRYSRSPLKRHSRSPNRRRSRSPMRRHSRSPIRRPSRSPIRRHSRSPIRRHSRSPVRRHSKSPISRYSRSPSRRHSRSPRRRYSKSPISHHSFSPIRRPLSPIRRQRSPVSKLSRGYNRSLTKSPIEEYRNVYKAHSPSIKHSGGIQDRMISGGSRYKYDIDKRMGQMNKEYVKMRAPKQSVSSLSDKHKSKSFASSSMRGISDLDPVSDEDESIYFDKQQHLVEDIMGSSSSKAVQFLQKFAVSNPNLDPSTIKQVMQFFESNKDELQQMMGSSSSSKKEKININRQLSATIQENILQTLLLSSLAGNSREPGPSSAPNLQQPQFLAENVSSGFGLMPSVSPHNLPQYNPSRVFPPNVNMPPPQVYGQLNQPHQELLQKTPPQNEGLFKDIKVTINKLFGANEMAQKQENVKSAVPGYVFQPDPEKWDLNHPGTPKFSPHNAPGFSGHLNPRFSAPIDQKSMYHADSKNINFNDATKSSVMRPDMFSNRNSNIPGQFLRGLDRQAQNLPVPPPDAKVSFCEVPRGSSKGNLFPVVHNPQGNTNFSSSSHAGVSDVKVSLAQRLASVLVKVGMTDVPAPLLQEMLMKIGAFSSLPRQDITEAEIISILKRLGYLS